MDVQGNRMLVARPRAGRESLLSFLDTHPKLVNVSPELIDKTKEVMRESWAKITELLAKGGAITSQGEIYASGLGGFNFPPPAVQKLDEEVILQGTLRQLEEELDLQKRLLGTDLQTKTKLALITPGADERLVREQTTGQSTRFHVLTRSDSPEPKQFSDGLMRSFEHIVAGVYSDKGLVDQHLVGPGSIVVTLLYDLSRFSLVRSWNGAAHWTPL